MATLTGNTIASTYTGLLSVTGAVGADTVEAVTDGAGTSTSLSLSQQRATITLGSGAADDFIVDGTTLVVEGDNNRVGIGTASPSTTLDVNGAVNMASTLAVAGDANFDSNTLFVDASENKVSIGTTSPLTYGGYYPAKFSVDGESFTGSMAVTEYQDGISGGLLAIGHSRGTISSKAKLNQNDQAGRLIFSGYNGTDFRTITADIRSIITSATGDIADGVMAGNLQFATNAGGGDDASIAMTIDSSQRVGIGTTSPTSGILVVRGSGDLLTLESTNSGTGGAQINLNHVGGSQADGDSVGRILFNGQDSNDNAVSYARIDGIAEDVTDGSENGALNFDTRTTNNAFSTKMHITSGGNVGIGDTSPSQKLSIDVNSSNTTQASFDGIEIGNSNTTANNGAAISFSYGAGGSSHSRIGAVYTDRTGSSEDTDLFFGTLGGGGYSEKMRIDSSGQTMIGRTTDSFNNDGLLINPSSFVYVERSAGTSNSVLYLHRRNGDGNLIDFYESNSLEGSVSVSGNTVSYNGFSGTHDSSGIASDTAIGTVLSTIDEEHKADHAKVKVSDSVGDKRVYGVLQQYVEETTNDDTEQTIPEHAVVASVGIGSVKVTGACQGGDLLESNGDGTAKVQDDDIIRSKTIGKVTIGDSDTGVKLVSCVLYCG